MVVTQQGAIQLDNAGQATQSLPWPQGNTLVACTDEGGRLWVGMELPESGTAVGLVQSDGRLQVAWRIGEPVGAMRWRPSDAEHEGALLATTPGSGAILLLQPGHGNMRRLATVPRGSGRLGGLALDSDGGVWAALSDGWSVARFTSDGQLDRVIGLPVPCATDLAFDATGPQGRLHITTARNSVPLDALETAPLSGRMLVAMV